MKPAFEKEGNAAAPCTSVELLHQVLEGSARAFPDKEAVVLGEERRPYAYVEANANRLARALLEAGIGEGDRVGPLMPNSVPYICSYFGVLKIGAVAGPINNASSPEALQYVVEDAGTKGLILHPRVKAARSDFFPGDGGLRAVFTDGDASSLG